MANFLVSWLGKSELRFPSNGTPPSALQDVPRCARKCEYAHCTALAEAWFNQVLTLERKRSERSREPFILVLLHLASALERQDHTVEFIDGTMAALVSSMRETDVMGWYQNGEVLGGIFTEVGKNGVQPALNCLSAKLNAALNQKLANRAAGISISWHVFPENSTHTDVAARVDPALYPDHHTSSNWLRSGAKRAIDILGSLAALILLAPLFLLIGIAVKMSSPGPTLFRQERIGQFGRPFKFLKFRTMCTHSSSRVHELYVKDLITGNPTAAKNGVYKIQQDPRITAVGSLLRRSSLDELPQFWNVLIGDMSLVGPRPPIPYETAMYKPWHRRRYLAAKPGITGLWQVTGRSRTSFDEMVRLDLKYLQYSSPWLDFKIMWRTPIAVVTGTGAY